MKLFCLRHGETNYNLLRLCNADPTVDVHLTPRGVEQARAAARALANEAIARIVVSPLPRARQTAAIIAQAHGAPVTVDPALHDWRTGLEGRPVAELYARIASDPWHTRIADGETLWEHQQRVLAFIARLHEEPEPTTLVVAHEETLRVFYAHFHGLSAQAQLALHFGNAELLTFTL